MKKLLLTTVLGFTAASFTPDSKADISEQLQNICTIVKNNDKSELRKKIKAVRSDFKVRLGDYYDGISCDGNSLIRYAMQNDSVDVGTFLIKKMKKSALSAAEQDGVSLKDWAEANGYISGAIGQELISRIN